MLSAVNVAAIAALKAATELEKVRHPSLFLLFFLGRAKSTALDVNLCRLCFLLASLQHLTTPTATLCTRCGQASCAADTNAAMCALAKLAKTQAASAEKQATKLIGSAQAADFDPKKHAELCLEITSKLQGQIEAAAGANVVGAQLTAAIARVVAVGIFPPIPLPFPFWVCLFDSWLVRVLASVVRFLQCSGQWPMAPYSSTARWTLEVAREACEACKACEACEARSSDCFICLCDRSMVHVT